MLRSVPRALAAVVAAQSMTACVVAAGGRDDSAGGGFFLLLLPIALLMLMFSLARRARRPTGRRGAGRATFVGDEVNEPLLRGELSVLADDVIRLEPQVALNEKARDDYEAATHRYRVAQAALDHADAPLDLIRVQRVVDEANWAMARARAILQGRTPPEPPAPLQRPGAHGEPALTVDETRRPVYVDSPAEFRSGWFGAGSGLFGGLLLGSMLGFGGSWLVDDGFEQGDIDPDATEW